MLVIRFIRVRNFFISFFLFLFFKGIVGDACSHLARLMCHYFFLAVLADLIKFALVGAPLLPTFLIFSPEPAAMRFLLA